MSKGWRYTKVKKHKAWDANRDQAPAWAEPKEGDR